VLISDMDCGGDGFNPPYPAGDGLTDAVNRVALQRSIRLASFAGRWNGVMAGWITGVGWSLGMTGILNPTLPF